VIRDTYTETQTNKNREQRWDNVKSIYKVVDIESLRGKHILLVDDVITTGSTIEACAQTILEIVPDVKISIASIAVAYN
jgi:predicted amidophosphoribosyltransferase